MARSTTLLRRAPKIESLETRALMAGGGPSNQAQYMVEVMNLVRTSPAEGAEWVEEHVDSGTRSNLEFYKVNLDEVKRTIASAKPKQPLAWNNRLAAAAQGHSDDMARNNFQSHQGSDGSNVEQRMDRQGYTDRASSAENAFAYARDVDNALQAFLVDWGVTDAGHRRNIQQNDASDDTSYAEVGIGIAGGKGLGGGSQVVTQNFGRRRGVKAQLVGVAFEDSDHDGRFSMNEGRGDIQVEVRNLATNKDAGSALTWDSGGYQVPLDPGSYEVTAKRGGQVIRSQRISIGGQNVKVDFNLSQTAPPAEVPVAVAPPAEVVKTQSAPPVQSEQNASNVPTITPKAEAIESAPMVTVSIPTANNNSNTTEKTTFEQVKPGPIHWSSAWKAKA